MNDPHTPDFDPETLIDAYLDETLTPEQGAALNAWVKQEPANARRFAKATWLHRQVYDRLHVHDLQQIQDVAEPADGLDGLSGLHSGDSGAVLAKLLELEQSTDDSGIVDLTEELKRRELERKRREAARLAGMRRGGHPEGSDTARVLIIPKLLVYGAVAAVVLGLLSVVYVNGWANRQAVTDPVAENPPAETTPQTETARPPVVAQLVSSDGLVWGLSTRPGTELCKGALVIDAGIAQVRFQDGALATFRGPAVIELRGGNRMALTQGAMVANVPEQAYGFTVDTPTMRVVDLGTEFGVTAEATGDSAVQVFVGEVTAAAFDTTGRPGTAASLTSQRGIAVDHATRTGRAIEVDGRAFEDLAPHVALLHRNLVINGDFEQGEPGWVTGDTFPEVENIQVAGWEDGGPGTVLGYAAAAIHDYPDPVLHNVPTDRGEHYYAGMGPGTTRQRIAVADLAALIDAGDVRYDFSAWLGGFGEQDEYLEVTARFLDERGRAIGAKVQLRPVRLADRGGVSGFLQRDQLGDVPPGTRSIVIELENIGDNVPPMVRDGYADNIELVLWAE